MKWKHDTVSRDIGESAGANLKVDNSLLRRYREAETFIAHFYCSVSLQTHMCSKCTSDIMLPEATFSKKDGKS